jgi:hypothetical protein
VPNDKPGEADLFDEVTNLVPRAKIEFGSPVQTAVVGVGRDGRLLIYFGSHERLYDFDAHGRLRKVIEDGLIFRSEGDRLSRLVHRRRPGEVTLLRREVAGDELSRALEPWRTRLSQLWSACAEKSVRLVRIYPDGCDVLGPLCDRLRVIASRPMELAPPIRRSE